MMSTTRDIGYVRLEFVIGRIDVQIEIIEAMLAWRENLSNRPASIACSQTRVEGIRQGGTVIASTEPLTKPLERCRR
jgi:hypothetical protein